MVYDVMESVIKWSTMCVNRPSPRTTLESPPTPKEKPTGNTLNTHHFNPTGSMGPSCRGPRQVSRLTTPLCPPSTVLRRPPHRSPRTPVWSAVPRHPPALTMERRPARSLPRDPPHRQAQDGRRDRSRAHRLPHRPTRASPEQRRRRSLLAFTLRLCSRRLAHFPCCCCFCAPASVCLSPSKSSYHLAAGAAFPSSQAPHLPGAPLLTPLASARFSL